MSEIMRGAGRRGLRPSRRGGFIMATMLGIVTFLTLAGTSLLTRGLWQTRTSDRLHSRANALHLADAALEQAVQNLKTDTTNDDITTDTLAGGTLTIESVQLLPSGLHRVVGRGLDQQDVRRVEGVLRRVPQSIFQFALFGDIGVGVSGSVLTDSFTSSQGPYNNDPTSPDYNRGHNGDIGTNATNAGGVAFSGHKGLFIDGQVAVGYGTTDPATVVTGYDPAFITGGTEPPSDTQDLAVQSSLFPFPPVTVPSSLACTDVSITNSAQSLTLSPTGGPLGTGVYCMHDLIVEGGGQLSASGPVTVYITGTLITRGTSIVGNSSNPTWMLVQLASGSQATLQDGTMTGNTKFYGALYGPDALIEISGDAEIFGSVIADRVDVSGDAVIHYDESLSQRDDITNTYKTQRVGWREL